MGKFFDALELSKKEKNIKTQMSPIRRREPMSKQNALTPLDSELQVQDRFNPKLLVHFSTESIDAEFFKVLRAQILSPKRNPRPKSIMVTSSLPEEGKTFVAANLAVSIAQGIDEYVLAIDCDLRRPSMHEMLGYSNPEGLYEFLIGKKKLSDLIIQTSIDKLSFLAAGGPASNPSELLASNAMKMFLREVRERYKDRFIIVDTAPAQITSEASFLANYVDGIILVVMCQKTPRGIIRNCIDRLDKDKVLGVVFNGYAYPLNLYKKYYRKYYK